MNNVFRPAPLMLASLLGMHVVCAQQVAGAIRVDEAMRGQMDAVIQRCIAEDGAPSASVAVVLGDRIVYAKAFGDAALSPAVPASVSTRYQLASVSKTFVAQAILLLEAEGKLSLNDPISRWYPDLTEAEHISLRQLLSHTAGYPDHYPQSYPAGPRAGAVKPDQIIAEWGHHPLLFPAGTQFHYSNLDYEIAGRIVEKVSGEPLFQFMQERIFKPLGMSEVRDLDTIPANSTVLATGYIRNALAPLQPAPYEGPGWSFGSGQVVTTAGDVARWDVAFLENRALPEREAREEVTPVPLANGSTAPTALGLFVSHRNDITRYYHTGEGLGFVAYNLIYPDAKLAIVVLSNTNATAINVKIADQLTYLLLPLTKKDLFARQLFLGLQQGQPDMSIFTDDLRQHMNKSLLAAYRSSLRPLGAIQSFTFLRSQTTDGLESRDYAAVAGGHTLDLHLLMMPDGRLEDATITDGRNN